MKLYTLFLMISSFIFVTQSDAAAQSSRVLRARKMLYTAADYAHLKQVLNGLLERQAYDEAYSFCYGVADTLPEKCRALIQLTLGKLSLVSTERGMPRNTQWAKWFFEQTINMLDAAPADKLAAQEHLKALEAEGQTLDVASISSRSRAKRSQRSFTTLERDTKEIRSLNDHKCSVCAKSFDSLRGLRIHQTLKGHKPEDCSEEIPTLESPVFLSDDSEIEQIFDGLEFREFTQEEYERTSFVCKRTFRKIQALRSHQTYKGH